MNCGMNAELHFRSYRIAPERHSHGFHQLVLPCLGRLEMDIDSHGGLVDRGSGALVTAGSEHAFSASDDNRFIVLDLPCDSGHDALTRRAARTPYFPIDPDLAHLLQFLSGSEASPALHRSGIELLLLALRERLGEDAALSQRLRSAQRYMSDHLAEPITVAEVAASVNLSASHLHALFRQHVGCTPLGWLRRQRVQQAESLLRHSDIPLAEVALRCGYSDQSALSRCLQRELGTTPGALRHRH